jgi:hypothetical protein
MTALVVALDFVGESIFTLTYVGRAGLGPANCTRIAAQSALRI